MRLLLFGGLLLLLAVPHSAESRASEKRVARLVFAATVAYAGGEQQTQIYSLEHSGKGAAQLTFGTEAASAPLPSPDSARIAFERGGSLWVMKPNGQGQRLLAAHGIEPAWTPDSRRIAYVSTTAENQRLGIRVIGLEGRRDRMLVPGGDVKDPAWSPDGKSLAFGRDGSLVVLRAGVQRTLVADPDIVRIDQIAWSADGRWLALTEERRTTLNRLEVVRADGQDRREVGGYSPSAWSPTRALLAYVEYGTSPLSPSFRLLNPTTGRGRRLGGAPRSINSLAWSPSGTALAFSGGAYLSEDLTAVSELGVITLAGRLRYLDNGLSYPLPEAVAWTSPPAELRYRAPQPVGPLVSSAELRFREPVDELVADGDRVAYQLCGTIGVWRPGDPRAVSAQVDRPLCGEGNIGFYNLALGGDRVAWGIVQGGNQRWNSLVAEAVGSPATRVVVAGHYQLAGDSRGDERSGYLLGQGSLLVFSTWAYCNEVVPVTCPSLPNGQATTIASQTLWRVREASWPGTCPGLTSNDQPGGHCQLLRAEPGPLRPLDVEEGRIVASGDNATVVLDADGRQLLSIPVSTNAAELAGSDLIVVVPGELRDYDAATGALLHVWPLHYLSFGGFCGVRIPDCGYTQFRLEDAARGLVVYLAGGPRPVGTTRGQIHLLRLADGRDVALGSGTAARFGAGGLFYAYQATGLWPGRIRFIPFDQLPLR